MRLMELFDKPYPLDWDWSDPREVTAQFRTDTGDRVMINFVLMDSGVAEIDFMIETMDPRLGIPMHTFDATGTGDAFRIFATVTGAIRHYLSKNHPDYVWFRAKASEASRIRLYDTMIRRAVVGSHGYQLVPRDQWDQLPDPVQYLIQNSQMGDRFRGWLFKAT